MIWYVLPKYTATTCDQRWYRPTKIHTHMICSKKVLQNEIEEPLGTNRKAEALARVSRFCRWHQVRWRPKARRNSWRRFPPRSGWPVVNETKSKKKKRKAENEIGGFEEQSMCCFSPWSPNLWWRLYAFRRCCPLLYCVLLLPLARPGLASPAATSKLIFGR